MPIKSFRGLLADGGQDTIVLHTNNGLTGYRLVKFELMANTPGVVEIANVVKIYTEEQDAIDAVVDFSDQRLLGAGYLESHGGIQDANYRSNSVFETSRIFNQDIFVTHKDVKTGEACNYYIELEQIKLDLSESTTATLKDIRNTAE